MTNFDYGNARIRAMKSRLLSRQELGALAEVGTVTGLLNALTKTAYRTSIEAALVQLTGLAALNKALQLEWVQTVGCIGRFFTDEAAKQVKLLLRRYDVDNVKAVLRGVSQHISADEIVVQTLPVGTLAAADLSALARAEGVRAVVDLLATWRNPLAAPLLVLQTKRPFTDLFEMELVLEQWYYARETAVSAPPFLLYSLQLEADITNLLTLLRQVGSPEAKDLLNQRFGASTLTPLLVGPGKISFQLLNQAASQPTFGQAIAALAGTPYHAVLTHALPIYTATHRLTVFELALTRYRLQQAASWVVRDPLGIGVVAGYLVLKTAEIANLRRIAQGIEIGLTAEGIHADLLFASSS